MANTKSWTDWTRREFEALPFRENDGSLTFRGCVILPQRRMHDSGYRCMDFVAIGKDGPICRLSGGSDVLHINGIGGRGQWDPSKRYPDMIKPVSWSIDCLKVSGLLHIFCRQELTNDGAYSSFELFAVEPKAA